MHYACMNTPIQHTYVATIVGHRLHLSLNTYGMPAARLVRELLEQHLNGAPGPRPVHPAPRMTMVAYGEHASHQINVRIPTTLAVRMDEARRGLSRADFIRRLLANFLLGHTDQVPRWHPPAPAPTH